MTAANACCDNRVFRGPAAGQRWREPTLDDILAGPIVRATMSADRVDPEALAAMLRAVALRLRKRTRASRPAKPASRPGFAAGRPACPIGAEIPAV